MKKIINVITLIVMLSVNIMTPFTYAEPLLDDFLETENFGEITQEDGVINDEEKDGEIEKDQGNEDIFDTEGEEHGEENDENLEDLEDKDDMDNKSENDDSIEGNDEVVQGNDELDVEDDVDEKDSEDDMGVIEDELDIGDEVHEAAIIDDDRVIQEEFTVTFDANRGAYEDKPADQTVNNGSTVTEPTLHADFRLPGYNFAGWYTEAKGGREWDFDNDIVTGDITLYAHWTYNYDYGDLDVYILDSYGSLSTYVMMDRNMGASKVYNQKYNDQNTDSFGYVYQWGNNWGFERCSNNAECHGNNTLNPYSTSTKVNKTPGRGDYMPSNFTRKYFVTAGNSWQNNPSAGDFLWGNSTFTTNFEDRQGPCPDGYHVPMLREFSNGLVVQWFDALGWNNTSFTNDKQSVFLSQFLLTLAGHHNKGSTTDSDQKVAADYWMSSSSAGDTAKNFWFKKGTAGFSSLYDNNGQRRSAASVRCFKNIDTTNLSINSDKGKGAVITVDKINGTNTIIALTNPSRTQAGVGDLHFDGWFTDPDFDPSTKKEARDPDNPQADSTVYTLSANEPALYAKWSCPDDYEYDGEICVVPFDITFDANEGTFNVGGESQTTITEALVYGTVHNYNDLPTPIRTGHVFKGWYAKFNGVNDYVDYGTDFKFNDKISVHLSAYMDNWSELVANDVIISSVVGDYGWHIQSKDGNIGFGSVEKPGGGSSNWRTAKSDISFSSLGSGWHDFDLVFDGDYVYGYLDGNKIVKSKPYESSHEIAYNSNSIFLGATPDGSHHFKGKIKDVIIQHSDQRITSTGVFLVPNKDVTYYALWEERTGSYDVEAEIVPSTGGNVTGTGVYNELDEVTLTATANEGYQFTGWYDESDNFLTGSNPYIFTADASAGTGLKAVFELKQYTVSAQSNDENKGTITYPVGPYTHGMSIMFSPTVINPLLDKFLKWSLNGNDVLTGNNKFLTGDLIIESLTGNVNVIGYFTGYDTCLFNNQIIQHGESVTGYQSSTVPYGSECVSEIRTCNDGILSGSYEYASCTPESASSCELPWGGTTGHGAVVTGYKTESETCPGECEGVSATCNNGSWSVPSFTGTYVKSGCTTQPVSTEGYELDGCPVNGICSSITGYTVSENVCVKGDVKFRLDGCDAHYHIGGDNKSCEKDKFDITWNYRDENGERTGNTIKVEYGEPAQEPSYPAVIWTVQTGYTFTGWEPEITSVTGPATYEAQYNETTRKYLITFVDGDGNTIQTGMVAYGTTPAYTGTEIPKKTSTVQTGYTFTGWSPAIHQVGGEETYTAQFEEWTRSYEITWKYKTETGLQIETGNYLYGAMPSHAGNDYQTAQTGYIFTGWEPEITSVTGPATYEAQYNETTREYLITFVDGDGNTIQTGMVAYGAMPAYTGTEIPKKTATAQTGYTFTGWSPAIHQVGGEETYTAQFEEWTRSYEITWKYKTETGSQIETGNYLYGAMPSHAGNDYQTAQTGYTFTGWEPEITSVTGPATYEAQYNETTRKYLITFVDGDGNTIQTGMVAYGTTPAYTGTEIPKKTATAQYTYIFNNTWSPIIVPVVGTVIYTAQFDSIINKYTVIWQNEDGTELEKDDNVPYGTMPSYDGSTPIRPGPGSENFVFVGWNPTLSVVVGDVEYTAKYQAKKAPDDGGGGGQRRSGGGSHRLSPSDGIDQHGSAEEENKQSETEKESNIYKRAYKYGITTIDTEEIADPDGYVTRGHLAKMMVNFMVNVLGKDNPYDVSYQCLYWNDDSTEWESDEIREYATKACALGIMGINTRNNEFRPNDIVTRAEFGTVASRVLWGDRYNELDTDHNLFYTKHLKALQDGGFMNDIDNPLRRQEIRKWVWLVLKRIEEKNKK